MFTSDIIESIGKKLILVIGGKDKIIPPESIKRLEPEDYGLNIIQISSLGHFLNGDVVFDRWYPRLIRILTDFLEEPEKNALSKREALRTMLVFHGICDCNLLTRGSNQDSRKFLDMVEILREKLMKHFEKDTVEKYIQLFDG